LFKEPHGAQHVTSNLTAFSRVRPQSNGSIRILRADNPLVLPTVEKRTTIRASGILNQHLDLFTFEGKAGYARNAHRIDVAEVGYGIRFSQAQRTFCFEATLNFDWTPGVGVNKVSA
jgi:hypothetical protein